MKILCRHNLLIFIESSLCYRVFFYQGNIETYLSPFCTKRTEIHAYKGCYGYTKVINTRKRYEQKN